MSPPVGFPGPLLTGSSPFTPLALHPDLWVRADQGLTTDVGGFVRQWNDLSGNGRNLLNSTVGHGSTPVAGVATIGGQPAIDYAVGRVNGYSPCVLQTQITVPFFPTTANRTVWLVLKFIGTQSPDCRIYTTTGNFSSDLFVGAEDVAGQCCAIVNSSAPRINGGTDAGGVSCGLTLTVAGAVGTLFQNNPQVATEPVTPITPAASQNRCIGDIGGGNFTGLFWIAEAAEWLRTLASGELAQLNAYRLARYGF